MAFGRPRKLFTEAELYEYAVGALARRMRSVAELKRLLRNRVEADTEIGKTLVELIVVRLKDQGYLNDTKYATAFSSYRRDNEKFGRTRVVNDLKAKGVHGDVIEKAVSSVYDDVKEEDLARAYLRRKRLQKPKNKDQKQAARIFRQSDACGIRSQDHFHDPEKMGRGRRNSHRTRERDSRGVSPGFKVPRFQSFKDCYGPGRTALPASLRPLRLWDLETLKL